MKVFGIATYNSKDNINVGNIKGAKFSDCDNNTCQVEGTLDNIKDNTGDVTIFAYK